MEILRDRAGVPHIYAASTPDLYFGLGVAMAQDRLWQMDRLRRRALGRQAEILGPAYVASDIAHLTVGIDQICDREADALDAKTRSDRARRFVAGINRQIELFGANLPPEFQHARLRAGAVHRARRGGDRARHLVVAERPHRPHRGGRGARLLPDGVARAVPDAGSLGESGAAWLQSPRRRARHRRCDRQQQLGAARQPHATRQAVLCGDPHQPFWVPSSWYEYALHGPEDDAAGAGHPGFPGMWWGSNGSIAWAITNNMASTRDLYREEVDPHDPRRYRDGDTWREFDERTVEHSRCAARRRTR